MRKQITSALISLLLAGVCGAQTFTDLGAQEEWKTGLPSLVSKVNGNFAQIENGTYSATGAIFSNAAAETSVDIYGGETNAAVVNLYADQDDDGSDHWAIRSEIDNTLALQNNGSDQVSVASNGIVTLAGGATLDNSTTNNELNITETAVKITGNLETTGSLTVPAAGYDNVKIKTVALSLSGIAATSSNIFWSAPFNGTIRDAKLVSDTATVSGISGTNWTFNIRNYTAGSNIVAAGASTSTGSEVVVYSPFSIAPDQATLFSEDDVFQFIATSNDTPTSLTAADIVILMDIEHR